MFDSLLEVNLGLFNGNPRLDVIKRLKRREALILINLYPEERRYLPVSMPERKAEAFGALEIKVNPTGK